MRRVIRTVSVTVLSEMVKLGGIIRAGFAILPAPIKAALFLLFALIIFFSVLKMVH